MILAFIRLLKHLVGFVVLRHGRVERHRRGLHGDPQNIPAAIGGAVMVMAAAGGEKRRQESEQDKRRSAIKRIQRVPFSYRDAARVG